MIVRAIQDGTVREWAARRSAQLPRGQYWVYFTAAIFFNFGFSVFFFLFNLYLLGFGYNERSLGFLGSFMSVGTLCGTVPAGIALDRFGLRRTLTCSIAGACVVSALRVVMVSHLAQIPLAVLGGICLSSWGVCLSPTVASLTSEERRPAGFSIMFASGIGVAGVGALAAGNLPACFQRLLGPALRVGQAERYTLLLAIGVGALSLIPLSRIDLRPASPRTRFTRPSAPFLRRFLPAMAVWSLVTGALPPFASLYFVHHLGVTLSAMGGIFSLSQLVQFGAILLAPVVFRWTGVGNGIVLTQGMTALMLFALARIETPLFAGWLYWGYMASQCMNEPGIYSLLMERVPEAGRGGASSYTFFVAAASQIVASAGVGILVVRLGYSAVLCAAAALGIVAAALFWRLAASPAAVASALPEAAATPNGG